jgi:hypothetical protein
MALVSRKAKVMLQVKENLNKEDTNTADTQETMSKDYDSEMRPLTERFQRGGQSRGSLAKTISENPDFFQQAGKFLFAFTGLMVSYLTWGYMQELIMTTNFEPTEDSPDGRFPSAAFCVFSNRFLAIIVAMIAVKLRHGSVFSNNVAPLQAFTPCALSNTMSSWSQYASLRYVSFPVQTVFKSSKIIPVMIMGKFLKGTTYPRSQYIEAFCITVGVAIFSVYAQESKKRNINRDYWIDLYVIVHYVRLLYLSVAG